MGLVGQGKTSWCLSGKSLLSYPFICYLIVFFSSLNQRSCGMDACEHEYASMSRHNRKVPTSFYHRFARDVCAFSDRYAKGRVVSVLEGGYSDRALVSGAMAHLSGLVDDAELAGGKVQEEWWNIENLEKVSLAEMLMLRTGTKITYTSGREGH